MSCRPPCHRLAEKDLIRTPPFLRQQRFDEALARSLSFESFDLVKSPGSYIVDRDHEMMTLAATVSPILVFDENSYRESRDRGGAAPWKRQLRLAVRSHPRCWVGPSLVRPNLASCVQVENRC